MSDKLAMIDKVMEEHHAVRGHVKLVGDSVSDIEAVFSLQQAHARWSQSSLETLSEKQKQLEQAINYLDDGLKNHFSFEEKALFPLLGDLLSRALMLEHRDTINKIQKAKEMVKDTKLEGLSRNEMLSQKSFMQQILSNICQSVEEHAANEEMILKLMKRALQHEGNN